MSSSIISVFMLILYFLSIYGWGRLVISIFREKTGFGPFYTAAHGLSVLIIIGGFLNLFGLAYSFSLKILFFLGLFSTTACLNKKIIHINHSKKLLNDFNFKKIDRVRFFNITSFILVCVIILYLVFNLSPPQVFNTDDDLKKYIPRTVKMLETGSVGNDVFSSNGLEVLGAQEYLHGFIHMYFPVEYMDMFDSIFCFMFSLLILFELFRKHSLTLSAYWVSLMLFIVINPQKVNLSSLYSGALFIICMIYAFSEEEDIFKENDDRIIIMPIVSSSLFCSSLLALKHTYIPFIVIFAVLYFITIVLRRKKLIRPVKIFFQFTVGTLLFTLPWVLIYIGYYMKGILIAQHSSKTTPSIFQVISMGSIETALKKFSSLFLNESLQYGGTNVGYTSLALFTFLLIFYNLFHVKHKRIRSLQTPVLVAGITYIVYYFTLPLILPLNQAIRYPIPVLCAVFPIIMGMTFSMYAKYTAGSDGRQQSIQRLFYPGTIILMFILCIFTFFGTFSQRSIQVYKYKTGLCFPDQLIKQLKSDSRYILSDNQKNILLEVQNKTKNGSGIFVWVGGPFHFDFRRNEVHLAGDLVGLMATYINFPTLGTAQNLKDYLKRHNIDYIIWERNDPQYLFDYQGLSMFSKSRSRYHRTYAKITLTLYSNLFKLMKQSEVIYDKDFTVIRL